MRQSVRKRAADMRVALQVTGSRQFSAFHYTDQPIRTHADTKRGDAALGRRVAFSLLSQGFFTHSAAAAIFRRRSRKRTSTASSMRSPSRSKKPGQSGELGAGAIG